MENCDGPIIWIVKKRLWYAPWKKKVIGVRVLGVFITLKQPEDDNFKNAVAQAAQYKYKGKCGTIGDEAIWTKLFHPDNLPSINAALIEHGGDPLPKEVMIRDKRLFSCYRCRSISGVWHLPYRIVIY